MLKIHVEVWLAAKLLSRQKDTFEGSELVHFIEREFGDSRNGIAVHAYSHCVANMKKSTAVGYRYLYKVDRGTFRLFRPEDDFHPSRAGGPIQPKVADIPVEYRFLLDPSVKEVAALLPEPRPARLHVEQPKEQFFYGTPTLPFKLGNEIIEFIGDAGTEIRVANPYCDDSSFEFLSQTQPGATIMLLIGEDRQLLTKIQEGRISKKAFEKLCENRHVLVRRDPELHMRFIIGGRGGVFLLSTDLQTSSLTRKYQFAHRTFSATVWSDCKAMFDALWSDADQIDLGKELGNRL